jgi:hypothetical protein
MEKKISSVIMMRIQLARLIGVKLKGVNLGREQEKEEE